MLWFAPERQILGLISLPVGFQSSQARQASGPSGTQGERKYTHCLTGGPGRAFNARKERKVGSFSLLPGKIPPRPGGPVRVLASDLSPLPVFTGFPQFPLSMGLVIVELVFLCRCGAVSGGNAKTAREAVPGPEIIPRTLAIITAVVLGGREAQLELGSPVLGPMSDLSRFWAVRAAEGVGRTEGGHWSKRLCGPPWAMCK